LRIVDQRTIARHHASGTSDDAQTARTQEETRYDPLGRRILLRVREDEPPSDRPEQGANVPTTWRPTTGAWSERYIWDGDQLLAEQRVAEADSMGAVSADTRDAATRDTGASDVDTSYVRTTVDVHTIVYTHGAALDDPLSVLRMRAGPPETAGLMSRADSLLVGMPHRDWQGRLAIVLDTAGRLLRQESHGTPWFGSLLTDQPTPTGVRYRRNRYFDLVQGRFTQEDPLGVAGGPSPYGLGDPVSYGDPFGLCRVEVRYARLGALLGQAWHHAYVVTTAPDLTQLFFRAGPGGAGPRGGTVGQLGAAVLGVIGNALGLSSASAIDSGVSSGSSGDGAGWGAIQVMSGWYEPGAVDWDPGQPPTTRLVDDSAPCNGYVASFTHTLAAIANRAIPYNPFTTNSNAVVRELLAKAGLRPGTPIVWAPGWSTVLLR
jgi:RHS repeat-associated protein